MEKIHVMKKLFRKVIFFLKKTNYEVKSDGHAILTYFSSRSKHWSCKSWNPNSFVTRTLRLSQIMDRNTVSVQMLIILRHAVKRVSMKKHLIQTMKAFQNDIISIPIRRQAVRKKWQTTSDTSKCSMVSAREATTERMTS